MDRTGRLCACVSSLLLAAVGSVLGEPVTGVSPGSAGMCQLTSTGIGSGQIDASNSLPPDVTRDYRFNPERGIATGRNYGEFERELARDGAGPASVGTTKVTKPTRFTRLR